MEYTTLILVVLAVLGCEASQLCTDKISSCSSYYRACSTTGPLLKWVKMYCPSYCGICHLLDTTTPTPTTIQQNQRSTYDNRINNFCYYAGKEYQQGEEWQDGCKYNCTCVDGFIGRYTCIDACANIVNPTSYPSNCIRVTEGCCTRTKCRFTYNGEVRYIPYEQMTTTQKHSTTPTTSPIPCRNVLPNCNYYPHACTDEPGIRKWARQYCANHCDLC